MESQSTFKNVPLDSKLVAFGNCFRPINGYWNISSYFEKPDGTQEPVNLSVEMLPALALGRTYSKGKITLPKRQTLFITLPKPSDLKLKKLKDYQEFTSKKELPKECENQYAFHFRMGGYWVWIPCMELARVLFFKTAESTRIAFYEANLNGLIDLELNYREAKIRLDERYPHKLLDVKAHQHYLAWLMLNPKVLDSYLSIYQSKFESRFITQNYERWAFTFLPFEMEGVSLRCYIKRHNKNLMVEEIALVANLPMTNKYDQVIIDHPLDIKLEREGQGASERAEKVFTEEKFNHEIDDSEQPSGESRHRVLDFLPKGTLCFNELINTQRLFKNKLLQATSIALDSQEDAGNSITLGIREGNNTSKILKGEFQTLPESAESKPVFFTHIRKAMHFIKEIEHLGISSVTENDGVLPPVKNRKFLWLSAEIKRSYFLAEIELFEIDRVYLIELDLSDNHSLTTLLFRPHEGVSIDDVIEIILYDLVKKSGHWDRKAIQELTLMQAYIQHPKDLNKILEDVSYKNWASRITGEF
jgi:hypothetical protein